MLVANCLALEIPIRGALEFLAAIVSRATAALDEVVAGADVEATKGLRLRMESAALKAGTGGGPAVRAALLAAGVTPVTPATSFAAELLVASEESRTRLAAAADALRDALA